MTSKQSGELTFKQAGIMLLAIGTGLVIIDRVSAGHWEWGGIPVIYIGGSFAVGGALLTILGIAKKA